MNNKKTIDILTNLIYLDIDAVEAYEQAIEKIDELSIKEKILSFKKDHERHIENLSKAMSELGGAPPERSKDFKGFLIKGFTALRSITGTEGALKAMHTNEKLTNKYYMDALKEDLPQAIKNIIEENYLDEQKHLSYINSQL